MDPEKPVPHTQAHMSAASILCEARLARMRFDCLPSAYVPRTEDDAYAIQDVLHLYLADRGWGTVAGYKIGCTTAVMQAYLGISNPCAGGVYDVTVQHLAGRIAIPPAIRVGVECEIGVQLARDLQIPTAPFNQTDVATAVGACMAAIEIVEDRYRDYPSLDTPTLIADDFFGAGCVLGPPVTAFDPRDLASVTATMTINGRPVGSGRGADVLGDPLEALTWLANTLAARGRSLKAGEFVLLGSLVQTHWIEVGDKVLISNDPLGQVEAVFTAADRVTPGTS